MDPRRTLIGNAEHSDIRTGEDGPYLAALAVRYPTGWALHGLSDDEKVTLNNAPLRPDLHATPHPGDVLAVGDELFRFVVAFGAAETAPDEDDAPGTCFAFVRGPDGLEECRAVDHDLLVGRLSYCHVQYPDHRLSRLGALLAASGGEWFACPLSKGPIARNRKAVNGLVRLDDGDELQVGPLMIRVEIRPPEQPPEIPPAPIVRPIVRRPIPRDMAAEAAGTVSTDSTPNEPLPARVHLHTAAARLERWLQSRPPIPPTRGGVGGWLDSQRAKLNRFWLDTPETTAARGHRAAARFAEAFAILDTALRARPDSPDLLRELYRLYDAAGMIDQCYRPLRQIEKLATVRGAKDPWVLEELARLFERLGRQKPEQFDRAVEYWQKLETATGVSYARERAAAMATRTLVLSGFVRSAPEGQ